MTPQQDATALQIARKVVRFAQMAQYPVSPEMGCRNCGLMPTIPVTGYCGHTRCMECIKKNAQCPCGYSTASSQSHVSITVQDIIKKLLTPENSPPPFRSHSSMSVPAAIMGGQESPVVLSRSLNRRRIMLKNVECRQFVSPKVRYKHACELLVVGEYKEAAAHLALVASSKQTAAPKAVMDMLTKTISDLMKSNEPYRLTRDLYRGVRVKCVPLRFLSSDMECPICRDTMRRPVTTPCGHSFCRDCIWRTLDFSKHCALCRYSLDKFHIVLSGESTFIVSALAAAAKDESRESLSFEDDTTMIPIFKCVVAFPMIPCPILILGSYHKTMISRILDSGTRRFGMVTTYKDGTLAIAGTIVEVRDCVRLEDGRTLLATVGISRFRTLDRHVEDDSHIARVVALEDDIPTEEERVALDIEALADSITDKVMAWMSSLTIPVINNIEDTFGPMPFHTEEQEWWKNPHCPKWLWWIIAVLPFNPELQVLMLSTITLYKRMLAVSRTLDVLTSFLEDE